MKKLIIVLLLAALVAGSGWALETVEIGVGVKTGVAYQVYYDAMLFAGGAFQVIAPIMTGGGIGGEIDVFYFGDFDDLGDNWYILLPILLKTRLPASFGYFDFGAGLEVIFGNDESVAFHVLVGFSFRAGPGYFNLEFRGSTDFDSWTGRDYVGGVIGYTFAF
jgi:hypothetical protein